MPSAAAASPTSSTDGGWVVGVDGGGTKTIAVVVDSAGRPRGWGRGGPANQQMVGAQAAAAAVRTAVTAAVAAAGVVGRPVAVCAGLAGLDRPAEFASLESALAATGWSCRLVSDARAALAGALGDRPGAVVIAGTGSMVLAQDAAGNVARASGWGYLVGDEGSAYAIGRAALAAASQAVDGRAPATALVAAICTDWGLAELADLRRLLYGDPTAHQRIATLAPAVAAADRDKDAVAHGILASAGADLAVAVAAACRRLEVIRPVVARVGSVWRSATVATTFAARLAELLTDVEIVSPRLPPAGGAAYLALLAGGHRPRLDTWPQWEEPS